ncbi:MAG: UDP-3-O-acyl-N-acetylglucosamine deacetylase, partial [Pseudomonadota bacterium]
MYETNDKDRLNPATAADLERFFSTDLDQPTYDHFVKANIPIPADLTYLQTENLTSSLFQHTITKSTQCHGEGLHSGRMVQLTLLPAPPDTGIVFHRTDSRVGDGKISALYSNVTDTMLCSKITNSDGVSVGTIEHLMSALRGCGIDNVIVKLDGPEVPIMDGSAENFVFLIECA